MKISGSHTFKLSSLPQNRLKQISDEELTVAANDKFSLNAAATILQTITKRGVKKIASIKTAELATLFAAAKRDVNEALANELAMFCETAGLDYLETVNLLQTGICETLIPTISEETNRDEVYVLLENAENLNAKLRLPMLARQVNEDMVKRAADLTADALRDSGKTLRRAKVALLGLG